MKKSFILAGLLVGLTATAQTEQDYTGRVGINTSEPKATLDISAKTTDGTRPEGILIPRITYAKMQEMKETLTEEHNGLMVFVSDIIDYNTGENKEYPFYPLYSSNHFVFNAAIGDFIPATPSGLTTVVPTNTTIGSRNVAYQLLPNAVNIRDESRHYHKKVKIGSHSINLNFDYFTSDIGDYAVAMQEGQATGEYSFSIGTNHPRNLGGVTGKYAVALKGDAMGKLSFAAAAGRAYGYQSVALGQADAEGLNSFAAGGYESKALGHSSVALAGIAEQYASTAIGTGGVASGYMSTAIGGAIAKGHFSFAAGNGATTTNLYEVALGHNNFNTDSEEKRDITDDGTSISSQYTEEDERQIFSVGNGVNLEDKRTSIGGGAGIAFLTADAYKKNAIVVLRNSKTGIGLDTDVTTPANSKPTEMLDVNGNIRVRGNTEESIAEGSSCTNTGTISFYQDNFYGCKSTGWVKLNN